MNYTHKLLAIALVLSIGVPTALAQTAEDTGGAAPKTREGLKNFVAAQRERASTTKAEVREQVQNIREDVAEKREEFRENVIGKRIEMLKREGVRVGKRLEAAILRLEKIVVRIESRIAKMKTEGIDTAKAETELANAKQKVADAKTKLVTAKASIQDILAQAQTVDIASTTPGQLLSDNIGKMKEQVKMVKDALKEAHAALVSAIKELKGKEKVKTPPVQEEPAQN